MGRRHILCDIDHTLSNAFWRDHMIGGAWDDYHAASVKDEPLHDVVKLIKAMHRSGAVIIGLTARPEKWRKVTLDWLIKHNVPIDELLMRGDTAYHPAPEIKLKLVAERFTSPKDEVAFIIDDRDDVVMAFKELGITALQVHGRKE